MKILRWLAKNLGTLLTAFILAVIVWVSAVVASDPNEEHVLARAVPIEIIGQDPGLQIMGDVPRNVTLVLRAPASVWSQLNNDPSNRCEPGWIFQAWDQGTYDVPVQVQITPSPCAHDSPGP